MDNHFLQKIYDRQGGFEAIPDNTAFADWANELIELLFPEKGRLSHPNTSSIAQVLLQLRSQLTHLLTTTQACSGCDIPLIARNFFDELPEVYHLLETDVEAIVQGDPAAISPFEVIRAYPGFYAICYYRIAHLLQRLQVPLIPRVLTEYAHMRTGIDIHPGAVIGSHFCIDHGTGIVIGQTSEIGRRVKMYQGVTLGALSVDKSMANTKRHPTVEDDVVIYSGATILGGETIIGQGSIIGGNVWLTRSVPADTKVYHKAEIEVIAPKN